MEKERRRKRARGDVEECSIVRNMKEWLYRREGSLSEAGRNGRVMEA